MQNPAVTDFFRQMFEQRPAPFGLNWLDSRVAQARDQLASYSELDRNVLRLLLLWMLDGAPDFDTGTPRVNFSGASLPDYFADPIEKLSACQEQLGDPPAVEKKIIPSWRDLYTELALDLLLHAYIAGGYGPGTGDEYDNSAARDIHGPAIEYACQACELLANSRTESLVEGHTRKRAKLVATQGGLARHAQSRPLKEAVREKYNRNYQKLSNREAARRILRDLEAEGVLKIEGKDVFLVMFNGTEALRNSDPEKQFEKWIGDFKKGV